MSKNIANAAPPHFVYDDAQPDTLVMTYQSKRGLVALMPSLVRGVGKYYNEHLDVSTAWRRTPRRKSTLDAKRVGAEATGVSRL